MKRRDFIKLSLATTGAAILAPTYSYGVPLDMSTISFSEEKYTNNAAQTIILFLYGGPSQLGGNLSNIEEIKQYSESSYGSHFPYITPSTNQCWEEAGGVDMEALMASGDMTLYRTCYSLEQERTNNKAHGVCTEQIQKGVYDIDSGSGGIVANIATILEAKGMVNSSTLLPFVTITGESEAEQGGAFYQDRNTPLAGYLKPVGIDANFSNPYKREVRGHQYYYTQEEKDANPNYNGSDEVGGMDPQLIEDMKVLSQSHIKNTKIKNAFINREHISNFIDTVRQEATPTLDHPYPNSPFSSTIEAAIKILDSNPDTKVITIGSAGLGGWDDHNDARNYVSRHRELFASLRSAIDHLKAIQKEGSINIMVFGEFGRNVNLNGANGWDHGNLQNVYVLGGKNYFTHRGVVGETVVHGQESGRVWLKPKVGTYWFDPMSIAATLYSIYGIENPNVLTSGDFAPLNVVS